MFQQPPLAWHRNRSPVRPAYPCHFPSLYLCLSLSLIPPTTTRSLQSPCSPRISQSSTSLIKPFKSDPGLEMQHTDIDDPFEALTRIMASDFVEDVTDSRKADTSTQYNATSSSVIPDKLDRDTKTCQRDASDGYDTLSGPTSPQTTHHDSTTREADTSTQNASSHPTSLRQQPKAVDFSGILEARMTDILQSFPARIALAKDADQATWEASQSELRRRLRYRCVISSALSTC